MRSAGCGLPWWAGVLTIGLMSSAALADTAQGEHAFQLSTQLSSITRPDFAKDMALAEKAFNEEDLLKSMKIFRQMAEQNYMPAQIRLGELLDYAENNEEAVGWYMMAANQGDAAGQCNLGLMYAVGEGIDLDFKKAVYWIDLAAEKNYLVAVKSLANSYRIGDMGLAIDLEKAKFWGDRAKALDTAVKSSVKKPEAEKGKKK